MTASLTGLSGLGTIRTEDSTKDASLFFMPMPGSDSSSAIMIDIFGAQREITLRGTFAKGDSGYTNVSDFVVALDALISGNQTSRSYVSDKSGVTYKVLVDRVEHTAEEAGVNFVNYTIILKEGNV